MMKKAISVLLATTLCASLATPAFATAELNEVSYSFEEFKKDVDAHTITFGESTLPETEMRTSSLSSLNYDEVQKAISREHNAVVVEEAKVLHTPIIVTNYSSARNQVTEKLGIVVDNSDENLIEQISNVIKSDSQLERIRKSNASYIYDNTLIKEQLRTILYN